MVMSDTTLENLLLTKKETNKLESLVIGDLYGFSYNVSDQNDNSSISYIVESLKIADKIFPNQNNTIVIDTGEKIIECLKYDDNMCVVSRRLKESSE